ncbi:hypothetical protein Tco_0269228 [Tanacetum coccineum]
MIVKYKIDKDGRIGYFKLIRVDGSSKRYSLMIKMLQNIDREDLETLWKLVKAKHGNTRPEEDYERILPLVSTVKDSADTNVISSLAGYPPSNKKLPKPKTATNKLNKNLEKSPSEYSQDQEGKSRESKEATDEDNDDDRPSTRLNQGKKTKEERLKEEPVEEPIAEVIMDDVGDDVVRDDDQPQAASEPKTSKTLNPEWFKQPPRPPTRNPELNKRQDPYEAIRQAYLVGTDTESESFEDPVKTEAPKSPHIVAPPTSLPDSTSLTLVPILHRIARMVVRVPPAMSPGISASMAEVAAMSDSAFCKRFRSSSKSLPSSSPPDLPSQKCYQGMSKLVEDDEEEEDDEEGDDEEEDEEIEESLDSDSMSEDVEDEGPTAKDEDPAVGDEGLTTGDEGPGIRVKSLSLGGDEAVPEGQPRADPVVETGVGEPLGLGYATLRRLEIALGEGRMLSVFEVGQSSGSVPESERPKRVSALRQPTLTTWIDPEDGIAYIDVPAYLPPAQTPPSPEWSSGLLPISPAPSIVPSPISSPKILLTVPLPVASPATAKTKGFLTKLGPRVEMQGGLIRDHTVQLEELSPALF